MIALTIHFYISLYALFAAKHKHSSQRANDTCLMNPVFKHASRDKRTLEAYMAGE